MTSRESVKFDSGNAECAAVVFRPSVTGRVPCIVMGHGFGGTMDRLFETAEGFAKAGFAALPFDYRSFGASGGEPRQVVDIEGQLADFRAAVAFARGCARIDPERIALWGNSLGGGHVVVVAAADSRIAAVVAQIPFNGFPARVEGRTRRETGALLFAILDDTVRGWLGLRPRLIKLVGAPGEVAVTTHVQARAHVAQFGADSLWRNEAAPRALLRMMRYRPGDFAAHVRAPLLVCIAESDEATTAEVTRPLAERAPRGELRSYPGTHFDFYLATPVRERALADQVDFLRRHLT
jgi:alpha-beta hydrolase superfamily lysophospholipase